MKEEHIHFLQIISKYGSITTASEYLNISPQALSSSIKTLEKELQFSLLSRSNQGSVLTPEGMKFLAYANNFYEMLDTLKLEKRLHHKRKITIYTTSEATRYFSILLTKEILEGHDDLDLQLKMSPVDELDKALLHKDIDGFFSVVPKFAQGMVPQERMQRFNYTDLGSVANLYCLVPKKAALYDFKKISLKTAADFPALFHRNAYDSNSSIFYILNQIIAIPDYRFKENQMEYEVELLLGHRIGYDFINRFSKWHAYAEMLSIIPLTEPISLQLCLVSRLGETADGLMAVLQNTRFERAAQERG